MRQKKYHIVTATTPNPTHDKRCRYGVRSASEFTEGSIIQEHIEPVEVGGVVVPCSSYRVYRDDLPREIFKTLPTAPHELNPIEEFNQEFAGYRHDNMVRDFLSRGIITIENVRVYFNRD